MPISRRLLGLAVATRLVGVTNATGYYGQIGAKNGLPGVTGTPADPPVKVPGSDLRVQPYFIVWPGAGRHDTEPSTAGHTDTFTDLDVLIPVTAAGGDVNDVLALVDRIDALLFRWTPVVAGGVLCGPLAYPPGYDPPLLPDESVSPTRFFVPLQYRFTAHT